MNLVETPTYAEFFDDKPIFEELIEGIPSKFILAYCSLINAELFNRSRDIKIQAKLFAQFISRFPLDIKTDLVNKIDYYHRTRKHPFIFFTKKFTFEFIHRALLHPNVSTQTSPSPEQELRIFKAYLLCNDELNDKTERDAFSNIALSSARLKFRSFIWTFLAQQQETNHDLSAHFQSIKLAAFVSFLTKTEPFNKYLPQYLAHVQQPSAVSYLLETIHFLQGSINKDQATTTNDRFTVIRPSKPSTLLQYLSLNISEYHKQSSIHKNYKGLKDKPLFEVDSNTYCSFSYGLFVNKLYNGFVFDFYKHSGISKEPGFKTFADFKSRYGKKFAEEIIFRSIIKEVFPHKHTIIEFSDADGMPDCYIRIDSVILLLEFKDYLFPDDIAIAANYELIKDHIDTKFIANKNGRPKGVNQILNYLSSFDQQCFSFDNFLEKKIKKRNITVYPVIVHTNRIYGMPDINDYLNDHFRNNLPSLSFKTKDIILIDLETIFYFLKHFKHHKKAFTQLIDDYLLRKKKKKKNFTEKSDLDQFIDAFNSIENTIPKLNLKQPPLQLPEFIKHIFHSMNIEFNG